MLVWMCSSRVRTTQFREGKAEKRKLTPMTRGLNPNSNHRLKYVFKSAAVDGMHQALFEQLGKC